jgi:hypothetical protein
VIDISREIQDLKHGKMYIRTEESEDIHHQQMEERLKKKYSRRLRMILKYELNAKNRITVLEAVAVPVLR